MSRSHRAVVIPAEPVVDLALLVPFDDGSERFRQPIARPPPALVAPILDLGDRFALELVSEFSSGHLVLFASKITKQGI